MREVFLLGCERSGSTWLANIFDAHPAVELSMEPFADYARLFPAIADRNVYAQSASPRDRATLADGYARLASIKYPLFYRPGRPVWLCRAEQRGFAALRRASQMGLGRSSLRQDRYQLLHLNSSATPLGQLTRKNRKASVRVTKELRLNFKLPLLRDALPESRFIVVLRNPAAQIASIQRWMQSGRLVELGRALRAFEASVARQERLAPLARACGSSRPGEGLEAKLARWWALNYSVLLEDLDRSGATYQVARQERVAENPSRTAAHLLEFAGLEPHAAVERYVAWSSQTSPLRGSATETVRISADAAAAAIRNAPAPVTEAVRLVLERLADAKSLHEQLATCLTELEA